MSPQGGTPREDEEGSAGDTQSGGADGPPEQEPVNPPSPAHDYRPPRPPR